MLGLRFGASSFSARCITPYINSSRCINPTIQTTSILVQQRKVTTQPATSNNPPKWELVSAMCLERLPIISPPMTPIELEVSRMIEMMDTAKSFKSEHERRHEEDKKRAKLQAKEVDIEEASRQTAQDFEDASNEELSKFKPASRTTIADANNDRKSTDRMLDRHLLFVVPKKEENKTGWTLPATQWTEGESLRQTAERALSAHISANTPVRVLGNAPWGVHTIKYPASIRQKKGVNGVKIFFFKAQLLQKASNPVSSTEFNWLGRSELKDFLEPDYLRSVQQFLIDED